MTRTTVQVNALPPIPQGVDDAIAIALLGFPVFPVALTPKGDGTFKKKPIHVGWQAKASTDPTAIRKMWLGESNAHVGILMGNGLVLIDPDAKKGARGIEVWEQYTSERGISLAYTLTTPTGGKHIFLRTKVRVESKDAWLTSVDVKGDSVGGGGFAVAYSVNMTRYSALQWMPEAMEMELSSPEPDERPTPGPLGPERDPALGVHGYAAGSVSKILANLRNLKLLELPLWNTTVYKEARNLLEFASSRWSGYTREQAHADLMEHAPTDGGFGPAEHQKCWDSAVEGHEKNGEKTRALPEGCDPNEPARDPNTDPSNDFGAWTTDEQLIAELVGGPVAPGMKSGGRPSRMVGGGAFILDAPRGVKPLWGNGSDVLWAEGEALMICGPSGVGKTRLARDLIRARISGGETVLGLPVAGGRRVLYLAMDRPRQIQRLLAGGLATLDRELLDERLVVWQGPPPEDVAKVTDTLLKLARQADADTIVVDSVKDAAIGLSDDAVGAGYNRARQECIAAGVEVLELHHTTKRGPNGAAPTTLADVYGSAWITNGAGSVVLLYGQPGDPIVDFRHLKQPEDVVGPYQLLHDVDGISIYHAADLLALARVAGSGGITAGDAAAALFDAQTPDKNQRETARRRLRRLATQGLLIEIPGDAATSKSSVWTSTATSTGGVTA